VWRVRPEAAYGSEEDCCCSGEVRRSEGLAGSQSAAHQSVSAMLLSGWILDMLMWRSSCLQLRPLARVALTAEARLSSLKLAILVTLAHFSLCVGANILHCLLS